MAQETPELDPYAGHTPAMRQFLQIKAKHPNLLLLYRMGDFYETFFADAELVHRVLGLTLTSRSAGSDGQPIPMAGIPYTTLDQYLVRLVNAGMSVGICEQIGTPGKGVMERRLTRIITPGTLTDTGLMNERAESTLLAINPAKAGAKIGLAYLTLSSGRFIALETDETQLANELARLQPSEILIAEKWRPNAERLATSATLTVLPDWHFDAIRAEKTLKTQFGVSTLQAFGLEDQALLTTAAGVVLEYGIQTQGTELSHITSISVESSQTYLGLDAASRRNLEISQNLKGETGHSLFSTIDHCRTAMGSRRLHAWLCSPLKSQDAALERSEVIASLNQLSQIEALAQLLKGLPDLERTATRIALRTVKPRELTALRAALPRLKEIQALALGLKTPLATEFAQNCPVPDELHKMLSEALLAEPASHLRDGGVIADGFNTELDELRALQNHSGEFLVEFERREKERSGIANLRVEYNGVHGYYIEVSRGQSDNVPVDWRRRQTLKYAERFITPELKAFEDKALSAQEKGKALERKLYDELIERCTIFANDLLKSAEAISSLDALNSLAEHATSMRWIRPEFSSEVGIRIHGARHPVVEQTLENYVPNNCELMAARRLLVITGPNMGGKSTFMRSIALIVLLAYCGSFVPAQSARLGPIDKILTRIGASDDLARGLSTFMVEMTETASILRQATEQSLVLMDEVGRGTSTFDGLSLAGAIAEDLALRRRSLTLFATHYFELTQLQETIPTVANVHVAAAQTNRNIVFLHEIREGPANQSYGIAVARLAGVPANVIRAAQKLLTRLEELAEQNGGRQLDLFAEATEPEEQMASETQDQALREALLADSVDDLSPRQAWQLLADIQQKLKEDNEF